MSNTKIWTKVDYEQDGKQNGWLQLPHSVTRSAYGNIAIPITVIRNGSGPTVLLMAGNHGDEYEGQIALCKLIRELQPGEIQGRVIVLPAANLPAAMAGVRTSPIDEGNLNRSFPGDADGTPTYAIAHYINTVLYPMADLFQDVHSGGSSLQYLPFASMRVGPDAALNDRALSALRAFGAPIGLVWDHSPDQRLSQVAAIGQGLVALGGEFGGGGAVSRRGVAIVERGLRNVLAHAGVIERSRAEGDFDGPTRLMQVKGRDYYVYAPEAGLFEPAVELGAQVRAGELCGHVHFVDNPGRAPERCCFERDGMVICQRHYGRVERGDCVVHLATPFEG
ncbi:succinylglutamate desuccinylase/aspartoacylase family protein [Ramlibacter sp.]|uniref:succinylglutamate desuccinylase/aspartoacylase family protein n=1 Tax=Ramlibacter sp. TaxID=1917967 RepID=UPI002BE516AC|nr:succinylglutamate desuccinylase/aspartoacylase family protein [Ramlibacter sp.]HWI84218.1 succinylglutamate desuccinylase/aspartoacylase family protein [Ramlibacter sp.]